jgi:hypothetical protein
MVDLAVSHLPFSVLRFGGRVTSGFSSVVASAQTPFRCEVRVKCRARRNSAVGHDKGDLQFCKMPENTPIQCQLPQISAIFQSELLRIIRTALHPNHPQKNGLWCAPNPVEI